MDQKQQIIDFVRHSFPKEAKNIVKHREFFTDFIIGYLNFTQNVTDFHKILYSQRGRLVLGVARKLVLDLSSSENEYQYDKDFPQDEVIAADKLLNQIIEGFRPFLSTRLDHQVAQLKSDDLADYCTLTCRHGHFDTQFIDAGPEINTADLSLAASTYIRSNFRNPFIDRLIFTGLAHGEIGAFAHTISNKKNQSVAGFYLNIAKKRHEKLDSPVIYSAIVYFFIYSLVSLLIFLTWEFFNLDNQSLKFVICATVMAGWWFHILVLKSEQKRFDENPNSILQKIPKLQNHIANFYFLLQDPGDLSVKHVRKYLDKIIENGGWLPGVMWVMLDTLESEGTLALTWDFDDFLLDKDPLSDF